MASTEIFKCRVCGNGAYSTISHTLVAPFGRPMKPDHCVCNNCSAVFDDPVKFTTAPKVI